MGNPWSKKRTADPVNHVQPEVWVKIFKFMDSNPRDLINASNASPKFKNLLENYKIKERGSGEGACRLEEILPLILKWLPTTDICKVRLSCKRCQSIVDKLINENGNIQRFQSLDLFPRLMNHLEVDDQRRMSFEWDHFKLPSSVGAYLNTLARINDFSRYLTEAEGVGGSIILNKTLNLWEEILDYDNQSAFIERSLQHFAQFSNGIRYLSVTLNKAPRDTSLYQLIRQTITSLPHLYSLEISHRSGMELMLPSESPSTPFIRLPLSKNLEIITIPSYNLPESFLGQLSEQYGGQLRKLALQLISDVKFLWRNPKLDKTWTSGSKSKCEFPALLELRLSVVHEPGRLLQKIHAPQLKSLDLTLSSYHPPAPEIFDLIQIIQQFPSIEFLGLTYNQAFGTTRDKALQVLGQVAPQGHQNIKRLKLYGHLLLYSDLPMIFFALFFPNLESIQIDCAMPIHVPYEVTVGRDQDFLLLEKRRFQKSNVWMEAPKLQIVRWIDSLQPDFNIYACARPCF